MYESSITVKALTVSHSVQQWNSIRESKSFSPVQVSGSDFSHNVSLMSLIFTILCLFFLSVNRYKLAFMILLLPSGVIKTSVTRELKIISNNEFEWLAWNSWCLSLHVHFLNLFFHRIFVLSIWKLYLQWWCVWFKVPLVMN